MYLLVFGHICLVAEVIEIACISFRVEFWDERCSLGAKGGPVNFGEVLVIVNVLDR
jgi:hypothetical protein